MARIRTHPGEVLREEFMVPLGMSAHQLAEALGVPANRISEIVRERRSVTAETALRLAKYFGSTPQFWLNLQTAHDLSKAEAEIDLSGVPRRRARSQETTSAARI
jgi:addiction module HigA family antidote